MRAIVSKIVRTNKMVTVANQEVDIKDYTDYYKYGDFDMFDVVRVNWNDTEISLYVDDEGMLKEGNLGRVVLGYHQPLFGNIIITGGVDDRGNTLPLPEDFKKHDLENFIGGVDFIIGERQ